MSPEQAQPPPEKPGVYIELKMPCPRCGSRLEKAVLPPKSKDKAEVRCQKCKATWVDYGTMLRGVKPAAIKIGLDDIQGVVARVKSGVRGSRNVVERIRAVQTNIRRAVVSIKSVREEGAVAEIGDSVENILDQVILALEDVKDIKKGAMKPFVGAQPPTEEGPPK